MTDTERLTNLAEFIEHHEEHAGFVTAMLDVCPDVIRFDCDHPDCSENLQIQYVPKSKWVGTYAK